MNICFIIGYLVSSVDFKFICEKKIISIAKCNIKLTNKSIIEIIGYNEIADYLYSKLEINSMLAFEGRLEGNKIEVTKIITTV